MSVSATTPWPANDASPWIRIGSADAGIVDAGAGGAVGLLRPRAALDHRVDRLEMARIRAERDGDLAGRGRAHALRAEVVLDVARSSLGIGDDRLDRPLALELAQDRLVGLADRVREDVQASAVRHPDHDLVRAGLGRDRDRLVEHRDEHVEPFERELLLAEEGLAQVPLEPLDLGQPLEQPTLLVAAERLGGSVPDSIACRSQTRRSWSEMCSISYAIVPQ